VGLTVADRLDPIVLTRVQSDGVGNLRPDPADASRRGLNQPDDKPTKHADSHDHGQRDT
jgi:hypothetical protein